MAIAKVQSVSGNGATLVLNGVAAGNALIYVSAYNRQPGTGVAETTPTDSNGTFAASSNDAAVQVTSISNFDIGASIFHEQNAAAGTHTVTPQANTIHNCSVTEFSGLLSSGMFDVAKSAKSIVGSQTSQVTGTTLTTAQANELEVIGLAILQSTGGNPIGLTDPVAGTTTLKLDQNTTTDIGDQQAFKVLSSVGTVSETFNWTTVDASTGSFGCIATFKGTLSTDIGPVNYAQRGGRGPSAGPSMRRMAPQKFPDTFPPAVSAQPFPTTGRIHPGMGGPAARRRIPQQYADTVSTPNVTVALTGASATFAAGTLGVTHTQALTGQAITSSAGTVKAALAKALTGSQATFSAGTLKANAAIALAGSRVTFSSGILKPATNVALLGSRATFTAGIVTPSTGVTVALTGSRATFSTGTTLSSTSVSLSGARGTFTAGTVAVTPTRHRGGLGDDSDTRRRERIRRDDEEIISLVASVVPLLDGD